MRVYGYILVMALVTFLVRALPLTLIRREIKNKTIRSFLFYVPYVTLATMTVPAIFTATRNVYSAAAGFTVALILAYLRRSLLTVACMACVAVFVVELIM